MKRLAIVAAVLAGCGPSASEAYKLESDVLVKLEGELHEAKSQAERAELLQMIHDHQLEHPQPDGMFGERLNQTKEEALQELVAAKENEPAAKAREAELKAKVEAQRAKVREAEEAL